MCIHLCKFSIYLSQIYINIYVSVYTNVCVYLYVFVCVRVCVLIFFPSFHSSGVKICKLKKDHQSQRHKVLHIMFQGEQA